MTPLDAADSYPGGPSFPLGNRLFRAVWLMVWFVFASWTPPFMRNWRRFLLRAFGAKIDGTAIVYASAKVWYPPNLEMAQYSCLGPRVNCYCMAKIRLEAHALVSQGAHLCAGTHDIDNPRFQLTTKPITVGARAWVAAEAFIGPGVTVGEGSVLGARSVAFRDLEPWCVYAGNPARIVRKRTKNG
jgi:putative colanic acid biosynthesis acetyltransferase WcaF